jgi:hypothetical protein
LLFPGSPQNCDSSVAIWRRRWQWTRNQIMSLGGWNRSYGCPENHNLVLLSWNGLEFKFCLCYNSVHQWQPCRRKIADCNQITP